MKITEAQLRKGIRKMIREQMDYEVEMIDEPSPPADEEDAYWTVYDEAFANGNHNDGNPYRDDPALRQAWEDGHHDWVGKASSERGETW